MDDVLEGLEKLAIYSGLGVGEVFVSTLLLGLLYCKYFALLYLFGLIFCFLLLIYYCTGNC